MSEAKRARLGLWLTFALVLGMVLRLIWVGDMEYKSDEQYMFDRLMRVGVSESFPWLGIPSGVYVRNPGMSVWVFLGLGKLLGAVDPTDLARGVQILNCLALGLALLYGVLRVANSERRAWLWGVALAAVNPFAIWLHRKIWAQSLMPFFGMIFLFAWSSRKTWLGAFAWGLIGACLGQIHMSGFFFAAGFAAWTLIWDRKSANWTAWLAGSILGAIPLVPWIQHLLSAQTGHPMFFGWNELIQFKYWVYWVTDSLGVHLGNPLGVKNGNLWHEQLGDFLRYPLIGQNPTYLMAVAHLALLLAGVGALLGWRPRLLISARDSIRLPLNAAFLAYGVIITAATVAIKRYYLLVAFPFETVWLAKCALGWGEKRGERILLALLLAQAAVSVGFIWYVHQNGGSPHGDYGVSYRLQDPQARELTRP